MKRKCFGVLAIVVIFVSLIIGLNFRVIKCNSNTYIVWSASQMNEKVSNLLDNQTVKVISSNGSDVFEVNISDLGISYKLLDSSNQELNKFPRILNLNEVLEFYIKDESIFKSYFNNVNNSLTDSKNAYYEVTDSDVVLHSEEIGTKFDVNLLFDDYVESISQGISDIDLNSYIIQPSITRDYFVTTEEEIERYKSWGIVYTNGFSLNFEDLISFISISDTDIVINKDDLSLYLADYLPSNLESYNTVGNEREFVTTDGSIVSLSSGTYGDIVNISSEVEYILSLVDSCTSEVNRLPIYSLDLSDELTNTYIEVSIDNQHLWYYVDGELIMETDVVTGTKDKHDTPVGIYYISEKIGGKYLRGDGYKTWVNQWMRLTNQGVGLHDAYWRGKFGGSIYTYNGSHGCINLPKNFAKELFDIVERKTAVIIY